MSTQPLLTIFDALRGESLKTQGMASAAKNKAWLLDLAREKAREIALSRVSREVTADDVHEALFRAGHKPEHLGNAAGSIFRGRCWQFTGRYVRSQRPSNHSRDIKVWFYTGSR